MVKATITAIKSKWLINLVACVILALLFVAEVNMYYMVYYNAFLVDDKHRTEYTDSTYSFAFKDHVGNADLDLLTDNISGYENVIISGKLPDDIDGASRELICFYGGISPIHDFRSELTHEKFNEDLFEQGDLLATDSYVFYDECELNGKKYRLIQKVSGLMDYAYSDVPLFCSTDEYFKISDDIYRITFEYNAPLSNSELDQLVNTVSSRLNIDSVIFPESVNERALETIRLNYGSLFLCCIVMIVITTCVIPIIRYCLWLRRYEFRSYRVCGADASYITFCEVSHVAVLGIMAVILGCIFSIQTLFTEGFWIMLLITIALFILRLLAEILISGKSNENIVEVNERWR